MSQFAAPVDRWRAQLAPCVAADDAGRAGLPEFVGLLIAKVTALRADLISLVDEFERDAAVDDEATEATLAMALECELSLDFIVAEFELSHEMRAPFDRFIAAARLVAREMILASMDLLPEEGLR